ncbi:hypothetical protein ABFY43_20800 [Bacillus pumilus]
MLFYSRGKQTGSCAGAPFYLIEEVEHVVDHVITQQKAQYQEEMIPTEETQDQLAAVDDDLYDEAVELINRHADGFCLYASKEIPYRLYPSCPPH